MGQTGESLLALLKKFIAPMNACAVLKHSVAKTGADLDLLGGPDVPRLAERLASDLRLFIREPEQYERCVHQIREVLGVGRSTEATCRAQERCQDPTRKTYRVEVRREEDIVTTVAAARAMCSDAGFAASLQLKIATSTSELTRYLVHIGGGYIELRVAGTTQCVELAGHAAREVGDENDMVKYLMGAKKLMDEMRVDHPRKNQTVIWFSKRTGLPAGRPKHALPPSHAGSPVARQHTQRGRRRLN